MQTTLPPYAANLREGWGKIVSKEGFGGYVFNFHLLFVHLRRCANKMKVVQRSLPTLGSSNPIHNGQIRNFRICSRQNLSNPRETKGIVQYTATNRCFILGWLHCWYRLCCCLSSRWYVNLPSPIIIQTPTNPFPFFFLDVMVSKLNSDRKAGEGAGQAVSRIYGNIGFKGLWNGLPVRIFMIGTLTAFQWLIYDSFKVYLGLPTTGGH